MNKPLPGPYALHYDNLSGIAYVVAPSPHGGTGRRSLAMLLGRPEEIAAHGALFTQAPAMKRILELLADERSPIPIHLLRLEATKTLREIGGA